MPSAHRDPAESLGIAQLGGRVWHIIGTEGRTLCGRTYTGCTIPIACWPEYDEGLRCKVCAKAS